VTNLTSHSLPEYHNPPIDEVVCGVLFEPLRSFLLPHFGLLWERFRKEYPKCQEVAPLLPVIGAGASLEEMRNWFDAAHEWIVRGFAEYTGIQIQ
jgi:hypothetical protein